MNIGLNHVSFSLRTISYFCHYHRHIYAASYFSSSWNSHSHKNLSMDRPYFNFKVLEKLSLKWRISI